MTYGDFLAQSGQPRAGIPQPFLADKDGKPAKLTKNEWHQLQRLYAAAGAGEATAEQLGPGRIGGGMDRYISKVDAYMYHAQMAVLRAHLDGLHSFRFELGYPKLNLSLSPTASRASSPVTIPVVMRVKPSAQAHYGEKVWGRLKQFDCLGEARAQGGSISNSSEAFRIVTRKGGFYHPRVVNLPQGSGLMWTTAWSMTSVACVLKDKAGKVIAGSTQSAGLSGDILAKMIYPDTIFFNPRYKLLIWPEGVGLNGRPWKVSGTKGWVYEFSFSLDRGEMRRVHSAEARLISIPLLARAGIPEGQITARWADLDQELAKLDIQAVLRQFLASGGMSLVPGAAAGGGAPGGPGAMPGGPGEMPGGPGMPPGGPPGGGPGMPPPP